MATSVGKRKAAGGLNAATKRLRIDQQVPASEPRFEQDDQYEDDDDDDDYKESNDFSDIEGARSADTPNTPNTPSTPFSPSGRKKFPSELNTIKCPYEDCNKTFNRPARLATHLNSHNGERPFKCTYEGCDKAYTDNKHLTAHVKGSHTNEKRYDCDWEGCGKKFLTGTRLRRHQATHQGENRHRCTGYPPCNQAFRKHQTLERHIRSDHMGLSPFPCIFIDPATGIQCSHGFDGAVGLRKHEQAVHYSVAQFLCTQCTIPNFFNFDGSPRYLAFKTETKLQAHIKKEHIHCPFCDLKVGTKQALEKHVESQHSGTSVEERKSVECPIIGCDKSFTKKANLNAHVATVHEGVRYICGECDVSNVSDLESWDISHGCGNEYFAKANLENHVRTFHLGFPDLLNANRRRNLIEYDEYGNVHPQEKRKGGTKAYKPSIVDEITGMAYDNDPRRTILCVFLDCNKRFLRDYDLQIHLRAENGHRLSTPEIDEIPAGHSTFSASQDMNDMVGNASRSMVGMGDTQITVNSNQAVGGDFGLSGLDNIDHIINDTGFGALQEDAPALDPALFGQEPEWETVTTNGQFWVGAEDVGPVDEYQYDEAAMRSLIDFGNGL